MPNENTPQNSWGATWRLFLYVTGTVLASVVALAINVSMAFVLFTASTPYMPEEVAVYGGQLFLYVVPFLLLFLEWWLWDILIDPFRGSK